MRIKVAIDKCTEFWCDKEVTKVRRLGLARYTSYEGYCNEHVRYAVLFDNRDRILTLEQAQLEIIKARL